MNMFKNPFDPDNAIITRKVQEWVRKKYLLDEQTEILVTEMGCSDAACPCVQTHIHIKGQQPLNIQIAKPLTYVRQWDLV